MPKCPNCQSEKVEKSGNSYQCLADACGCAWTVKDNTPVPAKEKSKLDTLWEEHEGRKKGKPVDPDEA